MGGRWQLQDRGALSRHQSCDHHDLAAGKFQRVMVDVRIVHVDLPESGNLLFDTGLAEQAKGTIVLDLFIEGDFGAGQQANRHLRLTDGGEAAGNGPGEIRRRKLVADLCRPRSDEMQTVIARFWGTPLRRSRSQLLDF
jgi:hypothetical protein